MKSERKNLELSSDPRLIPKAVNRKVFRDDRGHFTEAWNKSTFPDLVGFQMDRDFVQDNRSFSRKGTFRGLHYQTIHQQAKFVTVVHGEVIDVVMNIMKDHPRFGFIQTFNLREEDSLWVPPGYAHGFICLENTTFEYKVTDYRYAEEERSVKNTSIYYDEVVVTDKDKNAPVIYDVPKEELPTMQQSLDCLL
jgi:dTDP-4-dehydrorhamnose 3,5-epimerase